MFSFFKRHKPSALSATDQPTFAIGDIHGRIDLFDKMLAEIHSRIVSLRVKPRIVLLGDYIDRGSDSRGVIERIIELRQSRWCHVTALRGNHEQAMFSFVTEGTCGPAWLSKGGIATLKSYGVQPPQGLQTDTWELAQSALLLAMGRSHYEFLASLQSYYLQDDYMFVHAGVQPGLSLAEQTDREFLWIREPFLNAEKATTRVVVHGHTPSAEPENKPWRINVDTGAYATGVLTAVRLEGTSREFLSVR